MIHVERGLEPTAMKDPDLLKFKDQVRRWFEGPDRKRGPRPFSNIPHFDRLRSALDSLFSGKCAWCETKILGEAPVIANYRPRENSMGLEGEIHSDLYWWLAFEWNNLHYSCANCDRVSRTRFPLESEGDRAVLPGEERRERPLLLDPCKDHPEHDLVFSDDGRVAPGPNSERGRVTIEVYDLNREFLILERLKRAQILKGLDPKSMQAHCTADAPFAGFARQMVARWIEDKAVSPPSTQADWHKDLRTHANAALFAVDVRKKAFDVFDARQMRQEAFSVEHSENRADYFLKTRLIERIEIDNFKAIERLDIPFPASPTEACDQWPWLMLLGENSSGKSTLLEAIALTLGGSKHANDLGLDASEFVCRNGHAQEGRVRVTLTGRTHPLWMTLRRGDPRFSHSDDAPKVLLLAYGATRLLPTRASEPAPHRSQAVRIENLFNPFQPLVDPDKWLTDSQAVSDAEFALLQEGLSSILKLGREDRLIREKDRVLGVIGGVAVPLRQLSAGYQSVIALVADIMSVMHSRWRGHMRAAQGIVLIDEIGEHLHPTWKKRIVRSLREVFPGLQFVITTHDPLCLRGVKSGEVVLLRRGDHNRISAIRDLPPIEGMRIDQILTSEHFSLGSVYDEDAEKLFQEYYGLLALRRRTPEQEERLKALRADVDRREVLGTTPRERMLLEEIDRYLAAERGVSDAASRQELKANMRERIDEVWKGLERGGGKP